MVFKDPSYKVKNTFVELPAAPQEHDSRRRTRSDCVESTLRSPLVVASKSPTASPSLQPVDETMQAIPIDECDFELLEEAAIPLDGDESQSRPPFRSRGDSMGGDVPIAQAPGGLGRDEPAYVVPTTPSPFLHSSFPPSVVPPFAGYGFPGDMGGMGLPPAFGAGGEVGSGSQNPEDFLQSMQSMGFMPPEMYDPNFDYNLAFGGCNGWGGMPGMDGPGAFPGGELPGAHGLPSSPDVSREGASAKDDLADAESAGNFKTSGDAGALAEQKPKESRRKKKTGGASEAGAAATTGGYGAYSAVAEKAVSVSPVSVSVGQPAHQKPAPQPDSRATKEKDTNDDYKDNGDIPSNYTTVMLRNIPNKYTREMLIKQLKDGFEGQFDFMYLPIDFKNKCNVGYAFINFRTPEHCSSFVEQFHGVDVRKCLPGLNSKKIVEVTPARVQGLQENVRRLRNSPVMNQLADHPEWMPLLFGGDGYEETFPMPDQPLPPVKPRGRNREAKAGADM